MARRVAVKTRAGAANLHRELPVLIPHKVQQFNFRETFSSRTLRTPLAGGFVLAADTFLDRCPRRANLLRKRLELHQLTVDTFQHSIQLATDSSLAVVTRSLLFADRGKNFDDTKRISALYQSQNRAQTVNMALRISACATFRAEGRDQPFLLVISDGANGYAQRLRHIPDLESLLALFQDYKPTSCA